MLVIGHRLHIIPQIKVSIAELAVNCTQCSEIISSCLDGRFKESHSGPAVSSFAKALSFKRQFKACIGIASTLSKSFRALEFSEQYYVLIRNFYLWIRILVLHCMASQFVGCYCKFELKLVNVVNLIPFVHTNLNSFGFFKLIMSTIWTNNKQNF